MKAFLTIIFSFCASVVTLAQNDIIIFRDGSEASGKVIQVGDKNIVYKASTKKNARDISVRSQEVYMIHFKERGNVYITTEGKRISGENQKIAGEQDIIYLVSGKEIPVYNLQVLEEVIKYQERKPSKKLFVPFETIAKEEVFMIKYRDGIKDMITDITVKKPEAVAQTEENTAAEEADEEPEKKVVFHNVKKNETLAIISKRYGLKAADIIEWNDLPKNLKPTTRLQAGMQLMLYVKPENDKQ